jgi:hypothetical protein
MNDIDDDCDCPDEIINATTENLLIKCEKCQMVPYFTLFNYDDIQLNMMCEEEHSNHSNLDIYIRKVMNLNKEESICLKCNIKLLFCQFCKKCQVNIYKDYTINHKDHEIIGSDENIKNIMNFSQRGINNIMKRKNCRIKKKKKKNLFLNPKRCMIILYCILIKKIIREKLLMKNKFNYNIEHNIINAYKFLKEPNIKCKENNNNIKKFTPKCSIKFTPKCSIKWMTEFYSKNQINK